MHQIRLMRTTGVRELEELMPQGQVLKGQMPALAPPGCKLVE
ncbi:MAG: hypothetical protein OEU26_28050 [Candidatus Tectomicrobia bacterium]|nr:hypothetical protein [Candidatus Tectomicrobia bacterium]